MNPAGCSTPGAATDEVLVLARAPGSCDAPVAAFAVVAAALLVMRGAVAGKLWVGWLSRARSERGNGGRGRGGNVLGGNLGGGARRRWPLAPMLSTAQWTAWFLLLVLAGTNAASAYNGAACLLLGVGVCVFGVNSSLMLKKYTGLSSRLVPFTRTGGVASPRGARNRPAAMASGSSDSGVAGAPAPAPAMGSPPGTATGTLSTNNTNTGTAGSTAPLLRTPEEERRIATLRALDKFDTWLRFLLGVQACALLATLATAIVPTIAQRDFPWVRVSMGTFALYCFALMVCMVYQLERITQRR